MSGAPPRFRFVYARYDTSAAAAAVPTLQGKFHNTTLSFLGSTIKRERYAETEFSDSFKSQLVTFIYRKKLTISPPDFITVEFYGS